MAQQRRDVALPVPKYLGRNALFVRALAEYSELFQPLSDSGRVPSIAVSRDEKLVPSTATLVTPYDASQCFCRASHCNAVFFGRGRVTHRLMRRVATIADEMAEQHQ